MNRKEYQFELSPVEHAAWNLVYNMIEAGAEPSEHLWWAEEFWTLRRRLVERGLNVKPLP